MKHDMADLIERWKKETRSHCFEGSEGIRRFEKLLAIIGYRDGNHFNDVLRNFLSDNSGAIEALLVWIGDASVEDWNEALADELGVDDDEESEEEEAGNV